MPSKFAAVLLQKNRRTEIVIALLAAGLLSLAQAGHLFEPIEELFLDAAFFLRGERDMPPDVTVIGIDEQSMDHPKAGPWPWPRSFHAEFLDRLIQPESRPKAAGYDVFFERADAEDEPGDMAMSYKTQDLGASLVLAYFFEKGYRSRFDKETEKDSTLTRFALKTSGKHPSELETFDKVSLPFQALSKHSGLGFANTVRSQGGNTSRIRLLALYRGKIYPSLDLLAVTKYLGAGIKDMTVYRDFIEIKTGSTVRRVPITEEGDMWVDFYGGTKKSGRFYSFIHCIFGDSMLSPPQSASLKRALKDKLVFVGRTSLVLKDGHSTPFDANLASVFLRAQAAGNILEGRHLRRAPALAVILVIFVLAIAVMFIGTRLSISKAMAAAVLLGIFHLLTAFLLFRSGLWADVAACQLAIYGCFGGLLVFRYLYAMEELRRTQNDLLHSTKLAMVGQVSSGMAHEFRNILHAIRLHVEGCARPGLSPERVQKYMAVVFKILNNAELILNGILTFSRKNQSDRKMGDMKKTIEDTLLLLKKELQYQNIRIVRHFDEVAEISIDAGQMAQVVMNLINNARDALSKNQEKVIIISLKQDDRNLYLDIADNGPGIPSHVLKNLFQPFVTSKKEGKGTGLGLSVCKAIVENHNGEIKATSLAGQGTAWHIVLPKQ